MEVNGVAHIRLNVDRFEQCVAFYDQVMPYLGLHVVHRSDQFVYYVGGRTGYYVARADLGLREQLGAAVYAGYPERTDS